MTLGRQHSEYGVQACSHYLTRDVDHTEKLQRLAVEMAKGFYNFAYEERIRKLYIFPTGT